MTITVKHTKVSSVPDTSDTSLVRPSDWNADHTLIGVGTAASLDAGVANGVATLDSGGKVPVSQIPQLGDLNYQGSWNASTNSPTLTSSVGTKGYYYVVSVAGSTNLDGITDWQIGDWAVFNGSVWQKIDNTDAVTSVNGLTGAVVLTTTNIAEGTNLYYTDARARASLSAGTGISYNSSTGVITNSSPSLGGDVVGPSSATDNAIARFDTTTGKLIQNSVVIVDDNGNMSGIRSETYSGVVPASTPVGTMWFDASSDTLNFKQNNITQQIGEELFIYGRADEAITDGQVIAVTGSYGTTGYVRFAPAPIGTADPTHIIGLATEAIPKNGFGRITAFGIVHDLNTVAYADGDALWYDPTVTGGMTTTQPSAPNIKVQVGVVTKAAGGTNGSIQVKVFNGPTINDIANIQTSSSTGGQLLTYNQTGGYWKNTSLSAGTGISTSVTAGGGVTVTNTAPDQTVAISAGTGISVSGTYPSFTVANSGVTSLTGTASQVTVSASTGGVTLSLANPINVDTSGNAATVTNGVYTTGSYADPTWITSLAGSKISGTIDGGTF